MNFLFLYLSIKYQVLCQGYGKLKSYIDNKLSCWLSISLFQVLVSWLLCGLLCKAPDTLPIHLPYVSMMCNLCYCLFGFFLDLSSAPYGQ